jgi:hypothetical protein
MSALAHLTCWLHVRCLQMLLAMSAYAAALAPPATAAVGDTALTPAATAAAGHCTCAVAAQAGASCRVLAPSLHCQLLLLLRRGLTRTGQRMQPKQP